MKNFGKLMLISVSMFFFITVFTQVSFAQYNLQMPSQLSWTQWMSYPQQLQWAWPWQWSNQPNPLVFYPNAGWSQYAVNPTKCYTNLTVPREKLTFDAGSKVTIYGRIWPSAIGYLIVNPKASIYFDGSLVGTAEGDWNGNYVFSFPIPAYLYSGTHWVTVNATIDGCEQGIWTERVNVNGPSMVPYPYQYNTNVASILLNVTDCANGQSISSWAVLGNGVYAQSATNGQILFSNVIAGTYNYWAYAGGYTSGQGSVTVTAGTTSMSSICLNNASPQPSAPQTISVAYHGDDPPWQSSSHAETVVTGGSESMLIVIALIVLAGLIAVGISINGLGRKNLMKIPEQMNY